jgi:hypothetical protein
MRGKLTLLSAVIAAGAVVVSAAASTAAAKPKATKITCHSTVPPNASSGSFSLAE